MSPFFPHDSKGFELAIGTLVVMILGVIVVAGGIVLLTKIMAATQPIAEELPSRHLDELRKGLTQGQLVATAPSHQKVLAGDAAAFGVAVRNVLDTQEFRVSIAGKDKDDAPVTLGNGATQWNAVLFDTLEIKGGEESIAKIVMVPGKDVPSGTYTFIVTVKNETGAQYDSPRFFTVAVQ